MAVKGPLLSGALGSAPTLAAVLRWTEGRAPVVVIGPPWLGDAVATAGRALVLVEPRRGRSRCARAAAPHKQSRALDVALAGAELPLAARVLPALVVENVGGLPGRRGAALAGGAGALPAPRGHG